MKMRSSLLITSIFLISFLGACSVTQDQDSQVLNEANSQKDQVTITEINPGLSAIPDNYSQFSDSTPRPKTISYLGTKPWERPQPKLTHKQRFKGVLQAHNGIRLKHGLKPLTWSDKLARYSQEWADNLGKGKHCKIQHRPGTPPFGENLYRSSALKWNTGKTEVMAINIKEVVKSWTDEEKWYNYQKNSCLPGKLCGHYTQVVWRNTTEVGCAIKVCADKSQTWVCSYNPAGNWVGQRPY